EVYNLLKGFAVEHLNLKVKDNAILKEVMSDSFFLVLTRACKTLRLWECPNVSSEAHHQVYKDMLSGSSKLQSLWIGDIDATKTVATLSLMGITYVGSYR
ncbi:hypothetical protein PENTCL1PPCAC_9027, partial [Pristionchus entomophagus]